MAAPPTTTLTPIGDQPFTDSTGRLTMYALNYLQRLSSFVGAPAAATGGGGGGPSLTVQEQITELANSVTAIEASLTTTVPSFVVSGTLLARLRALLAPPPMPRRMPVPPAPPAVRVMPQSLAPGPLGIIYLANGARLLDGYGAPGGVVVGNAGDLYTRLDGGAGTTLYVKESGHQTTGGWVGK